MGYFNREKQESMMNTVSCISTKLLFEFPSFVYSMHFSKLQLYCAESSLSSELWSIIWAWSVICPPTLQQVMIQDVDVGKRCKSKLPKSHPRKMALPPPTVGAPKSCTVTKVISVGAHGELRHANGVLLQGCRNPVLEDPTWLSDLPGRQLVPLANRWPGLALFSA